jgi:hypothetical protein
MNIPILSLQKHPFYREEATPDLVRLKPHGARESAKEF